MRTEKRLGRKMGWLANVDRVGVRAAWTKPGDRPQLRNAVLGGWLRWEEVEGGHRPVTAEPGAVADGGVHGADALGCAEGTESGSTDRPRARFLEESCALGTTNPENRGGGVCPKDTGNGHGRGGAAFGPGAHEPGASRPRTRSEAKGSEKKGGGGPTQCDGRRERGHEQGGRVGEQAALKAAEKRHHGVKKNRDRVKHGKEGPGSTGRLVQMSQPQGAVSATTIRVGMCPSPRRTDIDEIGDRSTCEAA